MPLKLSIGQYSDKGRKPVNQDFLGALLPEEPLSASKGAAVALADGISSSKVSQVASETAVKGFLEDYFSTSEAWSVRSSVKRVLQASNTWLYAQTRYGPHRFDIEKGYVCTFSAIVLKSATAHLFSVGDTRIYRVSGSSLEQLSEDHRTWVSPEKSYLSRALGMRENLDLDYSTQAIEQGDIFLLATDGVYEFATAAEITSLIESNATDLDAAAKQIVDHALEQGSDDNLSIQIIRIEQAGSLDVQEIQEKALGLPIPQEIQTRTVFDGFEILRDLHHSSRSHVYLAKDEETGQQVVLKTPSVEMRDNATFMESFLMEEWVARRVNSAHLLQPFNSTRKRNFLYVVTEYVEGKSLRQWMVDNPEPDMDIVRNIVEQIAKGLLAMHRQEMLHQDIRPENIMIDVAGTAKIIDFGSTRIAGVAEMSSLHEQLHIRGTHQYTAPEYFTGEAGDSRSDLYSLAVVTYEMLTGSLPYGADMGRATTKAAQQRLSYRTANSHENSIPVWVDEALRKGVHSQPGRRYGELSEFIYDLKQPNPTFIRKQRPPLLERNPVLFWKALSFALFLCVLILFFTHPLSGG